MAKRWRIAAVAAAGSTLLLVGLLAAPASADVVKPAGACVGSGTWEKGGFAERSTDHSSGDTIKVPRKDTVKWAGNEKGFALGSTGPRRDIDGKVRLKLPVGTVTIDSWSGSSVRYANEGEHDYDLPSVLTGIKMKLSGFHKDAGKVTCAGSVYVQIKGSAASNPLLWVSLGGLVLTGFGLFFAGRPTFRKVRPAFEDVNPG